MTKITIISCIIAAVCTVAYAIDEEEVKSLFQDFAKCTKTAPKWGNKLEDLILGTNAWYCVLLKRGMIDDNDVFVKERCNAYCEILTVNVDYCKEIISKCIVKANQGSGSNVQKSLATIECNLKSGILDLIPKPE